MKNKIVIFVLLFVVFFVSCARFEEDTFNTKEEVPETRSNGSDEMYYWYKGERISLTPSRTKVNVIRKDGATRSSLKEVKELELNTRSVTLTLFSDIVELIKQNEQIEYVLPFFETGNNTEPIGTSDVFYVKLKKEGAISPSLGKNIREWKAYMVISF